MEPLRPRVASVMGVARALVSTLEPEGAVEVLVDEFGWDVSFQAVSRLRGDDAETALKLLWLQLVQAPAEDPRQG